MARDSSASEPGPVAGTVAGVAEAAGTAIMIGSSMLPGAGSLSPVTRAVELPSSSVTANPMFAPFTLASHGSHCPSTSL